MRALLMFIAAFAFIAAKGEAKIETLRPEPQLPLRDGVTAFDGLLAAKGTIVSGEDLKARQNYLRDACRDKIERAQAEDEIPIFDAPLFQREPATPDSPLAIYAVDRREDGCAVMVMMGDINDVRPVPVTNDDDYHSMPADDLSGE